jgi:glutamine amidotransferase
MIAVIDYEAGNLRSIKKALESTGAETTVTSDPDVVRAADAVVLPGDGHASYAVKTLQEMGITDAIYEVVESGRPFLGICVGMQVLFEHQEEGGATGLGLMKGRVRALPSTVKIPHMGWNRSRVVQSGFAGEIGDEPYYYFLHSYAADPEDASDVTAYTTHGIPIPSIVARDNVWGTQFHPEKSGADGLKLVRRFVDQLDETALKRSIAEVAS